MAGAEPRDVVNRWSTSGSGWKTRTGTRSFLQTSQQGAESLCGDYSNENGSCSGWGRPGTPRGAGSLVSPRQSRPVTPRFTSSAASPRHSQFKSPRGQSPRGHQQSPREPGPLSLAFSMPLPTEGGCSDSDEPHMASAVDKRGGGMQQSVQSQNRITHAKRFEGRKVPLLPLSSLSLGKISSESRGETNLHQQPLQMSGGMVHKSMHAEQRPAQFSHSDYGLTQSEQQQLGTGHNATKAAVGSSEFGEATEEGNAAVLSALEKEYFGSEDDLQLSALHADTHEALVKQYSPQGSSGTAQSSDSTGPDISLESDGRTDSNYIMEPEQEESRICRAYSIFGDIRGTLEQQNASALDVTCIVTTGTALLASPVQKTAEVSQQMLHLAVQDGTQQPEPVPSLSKPATVSTLEAPAGTCHADVHDMPAANHTQAVSEQLHATSVPAQREHSSPQQTPHVGLSAILDTAPDEARMLSNLPALSSQQAGPSQHGDGLLWMGINMLTADDVSARARAAAAAHPDAAESQHSGGAFSLTSDLSPESEYSQSSLVNQSSPAAVMIEGPASAPDFGRTPVHRVSSGLTAQLLGKGPAGGRGLRSSTEDERLGAFWPDAGTVRRVIVQKQYVEAESEAEEFEDASDKFFGDMSLSSGSDPAGMHDVGNSSSSSTDVSLTAVGCSDEHAGYEKAVDTQPSAVTSEAAEGMAPSTASGSFQMTAAECTTGAEQLVDSTSTQSGGAATETHDVTDLRITQDAEITKKACTGLGQLDTEAAGSATEAFAEQDAAEMEPPDAVQTDEILYELEKTVQQLPGSCTPPASQQRQSELATPSPDRTCWSPSLGPMLEETVGSLFAATPVKDISDENDV